MVLRKCPAVIAGIGVGIARMQLVPLVPGGIVQLPALLLGEIPEPRTVREDFGHDQPGLARPFDGDHVPVAQPERKPAHPSLLPASTATDRVTVHPSAIACATSASMAWPNVAPAASLMARSHSRVDGATRMNTPTWSGITPHPPSGPDRRGGARPAAGTSAASEAPLPARCRPRYWSGRALSATR